MKKHKKSNQKGIVFMISVTSYFIVTVMVFVMSSMSEAQVVNQSAENANQPKSCVSISITSKSTRLTNGEPNQLNVTVENRCDRTIEITEPRFTIERTVLAKVIKSGDRLVGRIIRNSELNNDVLTIEPGQNLDFEMDFGEIRWMDSMSSIEVFRDLFVHDLKAGLYSLSCEVEFEKHRNQSKEHNSQKKSKISSNAVELRVEIAAD